MNNELLQVKGNEIVTTSLIVAETFNKDHRNVIRKIDSLIEQLEDCSKLSSPNLFEKTEYTDTHNECRPMYYMNRDGFTLLAMGFTGKEALEWKLKYIEAFNDMEEIIHAGNIPDKRLEVGRLIIDTPTDKIPVIKELYSEYFSITPEVGSLEYITDLNTGYTTWLNETGITKDYLTTLPTSDIYNDYLKYCRDNRFLSMGKKTFYKTLEFDFGFNKKQKSNGYRYFVSA